MSKAPDIDEVINTWLNTSDEDGASLRQALKDAGLVIGRTPDFAKTMLILGHGYEVWAHKPHNAKWAAKLDGTPIINDLQVCMATAMINAWEKEQ